MWDHEKGKRAVSWRCFSLLGLQYLKLLAVDDEQRIALIATVYDRSVIRVTIWPVSEFSYYALGAVGAAFDWLKARDMSFVPRSVFIRYASMDGKADWKFF